MRPAKFMLNQRLFPYLIEGASPKPCTEGQFTEGRIQQCETPSLTPLKLRFQSFFFSELHLNRRPPPRQVRALSPGEVPIFLQHPALLCSCNIGQLFARGHVVLSITFLTWAEESLHSNNNSGSDQSSPAGSWWDVLGAGRRSRRMRSNTSMKSTRSVAPEHGSCVRTPLLLTGPGRPLFPE